MNSVLHPLGSATMTLGEPVVSINCLIMSGSLAHIDLDLFKAKKQNDYKVPNSVTTAINLLTITSNT